MISISQQKTPEGKAKQIVIACQRILRVLKAAAPKDKDVAKHDRLQEEQEEQEEQEGSSDDSEEHLGLVELQQVAGGLYRDKPSLLGRSLVYVLLRLAHEKRCCSFRRTALYIRYLHVPPVRIGIATERTNFRPGGVEGIFISEFEEVS